MAIKHFKYKDNQKDKTLNYREAFSLCQCKSANIIEIYGAGPNLMAGQLDYIILESAPNGSLHDSKFNQFRINLNYMCSSIN